MRFIDTLNSINKSGKIFHAYLIYGEKSKSKLKQKAKELAKEIENSGKFEEKQIFININNQIDNETFAELKVIDSEEKNIKVEEINKLVSNYQKKGIVNEKRIYIINEVDKLTTTAGNALLKFLEEPEENIYGILTTKNIDMVMNTIVSRCQTIHLENENKEEKNEEYIKSINLIKKIEKEKINTFYVLNESINGIGKEEMLEIFNDFKKIYLNSLYTKSTKFEEYYSLNKNTKEQIVKKVDIISKYSKALKTNANLNMIIDGFILEFIEV